MPEPKAHAENRPGFESLLRRIPGFKGYLEKSYRRESDALQRQFLADHIERAKRGLDQYTRRLADAGQLDQLPPCDRLRAKLDKLIGRIRGGMQGYSGVFDLVRVDVARLDKIYAHDVALLEGVEKLSEAVDHLGTQSGPAAEALPSILDQAAAIEKGWDEREDLLRGLE